MPRTKVGFKDMYLEWLGCTQGNVRQETHDHRCRLFSGIFEPHFRNRALASITPKDVMACLNKRVYRGRPLSPRTKKADLTVLSTFFNWCIDVAQVTKTNPTAKIKFTKPAKRLPKRLDPAHARVLLQHLKHTSPDTVFPAALVALYSGLRVKNLSLLDPKWNIQDGQLFFPAEDMKNNEDFLVPMHPLVDWAVRAYFPIGRGKDNLIRHLRESVGRSGLKKVTFHWFRHTFCSWLTPVAPWPIVKRLMGHTIDDRDMPPEVTMVYYHATASELRDGLAKLPLVWDVPGACQDDSH